METNNEPELHFASNCMDIKKLCEFIDLNPEELEKFKMGKGWISAECVQDINCNMKRGSMITTPDITNEEIEQWSELNRKFDRIDWDDARRHVKIKKEAGYENVYPTCDEVQEEALEILQKNNYKDEGKCAYGCYERSN